MSERTGEEHLVLEERGEVDPGDRFQVLALSGGGYRGLFTAILLEELEDQAGKPLRESFDLIAGTSIGGILAIGVATGVPASKLRQAFEKHGEDIFPAPNRIMRLPLLRKLHGSMVHRYSSEGLKKTILDILDDPDAGRTMAEAGPHLLVTGVNATTEEPVIFRSLGRHRDLRLLDVALATSAAPTYFAEHAIGKENFVDGGLIANAPDLVAFSHGLQAGYRREAIHMLSLGTVEEIAGQRIRGPSGTGYLTGARQLFELTLDAQQRLAIQECRALLDRQYLRIDATASKAQMDDLGLDRIDHQSRRTLTALATGTIRNELGAEVARLRAMLRRSAEWVGQ